MFPPCVHQPWLHLPILLLLTEVVLIIISSEALVLDWRSGSINKRMILRIRTLVKKWVSKFHAQLIILLYFEVSKLATVFMLLF